MQIDLFSSRRMVENYKKNRAQMETRKFKLEYPVEKVKEYIACENKSEIDKFIKECRILSGKERLYKRVVGVSSVDSAFVLEAMGLGQYSYPYQILFDFSDRLDYLMHYVTGCNSEAVRQMPGYHGLSCAVLNSDYSRIGDFSFLDLFKVDKKIVQYFESLSCRVQENGISGDTACMKEIVYQFFYSLMTALTNIRDYLVAVLNSRYRQHGFVYRSKNLSTAVISSGIRFEDEIVLKSGGHEDCIIVPKCYERYEYAAKEVFVCADCRKCKYWCR